MSRFHSEVCEPVEPEWASQLRGPECAGCGFETRPSRPAPGDGGPADIAGGTDSLHRETLSEAHASGTGLKTLYRVFLSTLHCVLPFSPAVQVCGVHSGVHEVANSVGIRR